MTPEVKKRIEQIRQGIVPEGYKKTKTDIVPADWKESPIGKYIREYTEKNNDTQSISCFDIRTNRLDVTDRLLFQSASNN